MDWGWRAGNTAAGLNSTLTYSTSVTYKLVITVNTEAAPTETVIPSATEQPKGHRGGDDVTNPSDVVRQHNLFLAGAWLRLAAKLGTSSVCLALLDERFLSLGLLFLFPSSRPSPDLLPSAATFSYLHHHHPSSLISVESSHRSDHPGVCCYTADGHRSCDPSECSRVFSEITSTSMNVHSTVKVHT